MQQRLPGGYVVGEAGDGLELGGFEGSTGNLRLGGELGGVEKAAEGDGDLFGKQEAQFSGEGMLLADPLLVSGGSQSEDSFTADRGRGKAGDEGEQRLPLEGGEVGVFDGRRNGIEERHLQALS